MAPDRTTSREAYVWIWLPGRLSPVLAGRIRKQDDLYVFSYHRSYLASKDAIPIYAPELPLMPGPIEPGPALRIANSLGDAAPGAWSRWVIAYRLAARRGGNVGELDELAYMLRSASDRFGALDFQHSPNTYVPREGQGEPLESLLSAAEQVGRGLPLEPGIAEALLHSSAISGERPKVSCGGARPRVLIRDGKRKYIAKFSCPTDTHSAVKAEFAAMRLAGIVGLDVAPVRLVRVMDKDVLLVERFDREAVQGGWTRRAMVSALTLFGPGEFMSRRASYETLADIIRARFTASRKTLEEVFSRLTFNVLVGNTDDHARNHAAFWDGSSLTLAPAYDICPQVRPGCKAFQGMLIHGQERRSRLSVCLAASHRFLLAQERAAAIIRAQVVAVMENWEAVCNEANLPDADRRLLWRQQVLSDRVFEGLDSRFETHSAIRRLVH